MRIYRSLKAKIYNNHRLECISNSINNGCIYEFGVDFGNGIHNFIEGYIDHNKTFDTIFGFDSFEGLPEPESDRLQAPSWIKGAYDARRKLHTKDPEKTRKIIHKYLHLLHPLSNIKLIKCWFNELNSDYITKYCMKPASYVRIDCDLYSSTISALSFMYDNKLIIPGTIINYDDLLPGHIMTEGEGLAHTEISDKYNIKYKKYNDQIYIVESIG